MVRGKKGRERSSQENLPFEAVQALDLPDTDFKTTIIDGRKELKGNHV